MSISIRTFDVLPSNTCERNAANLQRAIDWAHENGSALFVEPGEPYPIAGGIVLRRNVSLVGVHGPVGRGTCHPTGKRPVGSVFAITDREQPFITVEGATHLRGLQFWYPEQTLRDPTKIIPYPATIRGSQTSAPMGVTLSCLSFFGEWLAMDFNQTQQVICEQVLFEHCYGYPLSGEFIRIDYCYDIPRILHCHVNPANMRYFSGDFSKPVIDAVVARKTFTYVIDHTDNAQLIDLFTFGVYGGIRLGAHSYGQLTNFNLDCVAVGVLKQGDNDFNRNWQISQGSIIANLGATVDDIHPLIIEGTGHTSLVNVEAFSGHNGALTTCGMSQDFLLVRGDQACTVSVIGSRMRNYVAAEPITVTNPHALVQAVACVDHQLHAFQRTWTPSI